MSLDYEDRGPLSAIKDYAEFNELLSEGREQDKDIYNEGGKEED